MHVTVSPVLQTSMCNNLNVTLVMGGPVYIFFFAVLIIGSVAIKRGIRYFSWSFWFKNKMFLPIEYNHICALLLETCETPAGHRIDVNSVPPAVGKKIIFPLCGPSFPTSYYNTRLQQMEAPPPPGLPTSSPPPCLMWDDLTRWIRLKYPLHTSSLSNMGLMILLMT